MPDQRTLVVVGTGTATGTPDQCVLHIALNGMGATPSEALEICSTAAAGAIEALVEMGVGRDDVRTVNLSLQDFFDQAQQKVTARIGSHQIEVTVRDLGQVGRVIAALSDATGDALQIRSMQLGVQDAEPMQREARRDAVRGAQEKAIQLSEAAGVRLGAIASVEDGEAGAIANPSARAMSLSSGNMGASMPVEPGQVSVLSKVTITYALED
jgi:uncharacterized protein YggE